MLSDKGFLAICSCDVHSSARVCVGAVVGKPFRPLLETTPEAGAESKTTIGPNAYVGYYSVIGAGSVLDDSVIVDDYCSIESDVRIGARTLVVYRAQICNEACVGSDCVIGGFVAERVVIGDRVRVFGKIIHSHLDPTLGWDAPESLEESAIVEPDAFIGFDALVVGKVVVGSMAYVCAGAIVTRDVPSRYVAYGVNKMVPVDQWKGLLSRSAFFANRRAE